MCSDLRSFESTDFYFTFMTTNTLTGVFEVPVSYLLQHKTWKRFYSGLCGLHVKNKSSRFMLFVFGWTLSVAAGLKKKNTLSHLRSPRGCDRFHASLWHCLTRQWWQRWTLKQRVSQTEKPSSWRLHRGGFCWGERRTHYFVALWRFPLTWKKWFFLKYWGEKKKKVKDPRQTCWSPTSLEPLNQSPASNIVKEAQTEAKH